MGSQVGQTARRHSWGGGSSPQAGRGSAGGAAPAGRSGTGRAEAVPITSRKLALTWACCRRAPTGPSSGWEVGVPWLPGLTFSAVGMIVFLAVLQLIIFAVSALLNTLRNISQQLLQNSVSMRIQLMVMEKAASLDLQFYEDPASYDLLRRAQNDSINRPVLMIATAFGLLQTILTLVTMIVLLFGVSWILAAVVLVSPIPAFIADTRYGWRGYNIARWGSRLLRRMTYMVNLVTTDSFAKEVKLFGLGQYFIERYRLIANAFYDSQKSQLVRRYMTGFVLGNLSTIVTSITYLYIALQAIAGRMSLGSLTAYTQG